MLAMVAATGCLPRDAFAPPPDNYEMWTKPGADDVRTWKDLLECNYPSPFGGGARIEGGNRTLEEGAGSMICMERLGYSYKEGHRVQRVCDLSGVKGRQACISGAGVPTPDVQRRLSSGYCKKYPQSEACTP